MAQFCVPFLLYFCALGMAFKAVNFNGGGIFFWWQAGCCQYLLENGFQEHAARTGCKIEGASAGALSAALLATGADFQYAADYAIFQCKRDKILESKRLAFVWGPIVREWLDELIPEEKCCAPTTSSLEIKVTLAELYRGPVQEVLSNFESKQEIISACMASVHIPLFMDGTLFNYVPHKQAWYLDGSLWPFLLGDDLFQCLQQQRRQSSIAPEDVYIVDWQRDAEFAQQVQEGFTSMISPDRLHGMVASGYEFMKREHALKRAPLPL
jgi:predicted acylesterase/phospholipase RssA